MTNMVSARKISMPTFRCEKSIFVLFIFENALSYDWLIRPDYVKTRNQGIPSTVGGSQYLLSGNSIKPRPVGYIFDVLNISIFCQKF